MKSLEIAFGWGLSLLLPKLSQISYRCKRIAVHLAPFVLMPALKKHWMEQPLFKGSAVSIVFHPARAEAGLFLVMLAGSSVRMQEHKNNLVGIIYSLPPKHSVPH